MIGVFAAYFGALISTCSDIINDIINYINGYEFAAEVAVYLPNSICLFERLSVLEIALDLAMVCRFVAVVFAALLSSIYGFIQVYFVD